MKVLSVLFVVIAAVAALPTDPVIRKLDPEGPRYEYVVDEDGRPHLEDTWVKLSDLEKMARYNPDTQNQYHLFTRANPTRSQPLVINNAAVLAASNFDSRRRTVITIHGFLGSATAGSNQALVPAYLAGEDVNMIVVDWSAGSHWGLNGIQSGRAIARFINWLNSASGARPQQYHIIGFSVGGHSAGVTAKNVNGNIGYVTGLDPASRWEDAEILRPSDASYVEVIHTSAGVNGWGQPLGHVDFYPNGGSVMPGCNLNVICDHNRSYYYMAESVATGGFNARRCPTYWDAIIGDCRLPDSLRMGGRTPKTGSTGLYGLRTNRGSPYSQG